MNERDIIPSPLKYFYSDEEWKRTERWIFTGVIIGVGRFRILGGGARFRILGGPRFRIFGGPRGGQIPSRHTTS